MKRIYDLCRKSKNKIIEIAYEDVKEFYTKAEKTDKLIIDEIEYKIYQAEQDLEYDDSFNRRDITNAKKFLNKISKIYLENEELESINKKLNVIKNEILSNKRIRKVLQ